VRTEYAILPYRVLDPKLIEIRKNYYSCFSLFIFSLFLFSGSIIIGGLLNSYIAYPFYKILVAPTITGVSSASSTLGGSGFSDMVVIFAKNSIAVILAIIFARRTRGISLGFLLILNGFAIGSILMALGTFGYPVKELAAGIIPHGIPEFVGILIGASLGFRLLFVNENKLERFKKYVKIKCIIVVLPILLVVASIEAYVTPIIMSIV